MTVSAAKASLIVDYIMVSLYLIVAIFFTFMLFKVCKIKDKALRRAIITMVVCLQISALCKFSSTLASLYSSFYLF